MGLKTNSIWLFAFLFALFSIIIALFTLPPPSQMPISVTFKASLVTKFVSQSSEFISSLKRMVFRHQHRHHHHRHHHHRRGHKPKCDHIKWISNSITSSLIYKYKVSLVLTVDLEGCANFSTVQKAVDEVPDSSPTKTLIVIFSGTYREKVVLYKSKSNLIIQGEGFLNTAIEWIDTANSTGGTVSSSSVAIFSPNFTAYNISFKNAAPEPMPGEIGQQAVALRIAGDQAVS